MRNAGEVDLSAAFGDRQMGRAEATGSPRACCSGRLGPRVQAVLRGWGRAGQWAVSARADNFFLSGFSEGKQKCKKQLFKNFCSFPER